MAIYKRPDKNGKIRYMVRVESSDPETGKRKRVTVGTFPTKKRAQEAEARAITERERGTLLNPDRTTIGELLDRYLEIEVPRTVQPENQQAYEIVVRKHLKSALGSVSVRKLRVEHVERLYAHLQAEGYSSSLIKKCHMRLKSALQLAKRWQIVAENVCDSVDPPKLAHKQPEIWMPAEVEAFLDVAAEEKLYVYWLLSVETGARTSELLGVPWSDIDLERRTIRFGAQVVRLLKGTPIVKKGAKTEAGHRTIPLTAGTVDELKAFRETWRTWMSGSGEPDWNPHNLVFCSPGGLPRNARNLRRTFDRMVSVAGVKPIGPHGIRKTHITTTIAKGGNVKAVAARVGHRDISTTLKTYTALTASMDDELMSIVEAVVPHRKVKGTD